MKFIILSVQVLINKILIFCVLLIILCGERLINLDYLWSSLSVSDGFCHFMSKKKTKFRTQYIVYV